MKRFINTMKKFLSSLLCHKSKLEVTYEYPPIDDIPEKRTSLPPLASSILTRIPSIKKDKSIGKG